MGKNIINKNSIDIFCKKHHITKLALFGSILREDSHKDSDIDVLVEFENGHTPSFFHLFEMEDELTKIMGGRKVDLRTPQDLSRYFRNDVISTMEIEYET